MANYGLSITEDYVSLKCFSNEKVLSLPFYICKLKNSDGFLIGDEAYKKRLAGEAIGVDKLLSLYIKGTVATLYNKTYSSTALITEFFKILFSKFDDIEYLCVTSYDNSIQTLNYLNSVFVELKDYIPNFSITSFAEALSYYSVCQNEHGHFAFIELDEQRLTFFDASFVKDKKKDILILQKQVQHEAFSLDILDEDAGKKIADKILFDFAHKYIEGKNFTHIFLIGKGFILKDYYKSFMNYICLRSKVCVEIYAFVIGAAIKAHDSCFDGKIINKYRVFNDARLEYSLFFEAKEMGDVVKKIAAKAGDEWYKKQVVFYVIPDNVGEMQVSYQLVNSPTPVDIIIPLPIEPMRMNKATRLRISFTFSEAHKIDVVIEEHGFGEFYIATHKKRTKEIVI